MCIIAIKPKGMKMFDDYTLTTMFINNPDGAGFMYHDGKNVVIKKGFMTCKSLKKELAKHDFTNTNLVLHFRIGTSGLNDELNCHPYPINQKNKLNCKTALGMAHNGILRNYIPPKTAPINDTQFFINSVLNNLSPNFLRNKDVVTLIKQLIGMNKLAFLDDKNRLTLIGDFIEDSGYIYSNDSYKMSTLYSYVPKPVKTKVCPKKTDVSNCVSKRYKLTSDELDFWHDEPNDFWSDWDKRHPHNY